MWTLQHLDYRSCFGWQNVSNLFLGKCIILTIQTEFAAYYKTLNFKIMTEVRTRGLNVQCCRGTLSFWLVKN